MNITEWNLERVFVLFYVENPFDEVILMSILNTETMHRNDMQLKQTTTTSRTLHFSGRCRGPILPTGGVNPVCLRLVP